jgi:protein transport protein SEC24
MPKHLSNMVFCTALPCLAAAQVDLTFSSCPPLQPLPRLVYALLRSPLLSSAAQYHSDLTAYLHHLWCCLPPRELAKAVYPGAACCCCC